MPILPLQENSNRNLKDRFMFVYLSPWLAVFGFYLAFRIVSFSANIPFFFLSSKPPHRFRASVAGYL